MWISDTSIRRPVLATMAIMSFVVLGLVAVTRLGIDLYPNVTLPFVIVTTVYPGASPTEVESQVSRPIEDAVAAINGVKRVESTSTESLSRVVIEFNLGVDAQNAAAEVREKVAAKRFALPREIESPNISRFDVTALPIMTFGVGSALPPDETRRLVEDDLKPQLEQIDGVAAVDVQGGLVREIHVDLDARRLEALRLPAVAVAEAIAAGNLDVPAGKVTRGGQDVSLRTKGEFTRLDELSHLILRSSGGSSVRLRDVADVSDGFEERTATTRLDGKDAVSFSIRKQSGANSAEVSARVRARLARVAPTLPALRIQGVHDDAEYIHDNVADVRFNIVFGGVMAVLIIFVFMRDWRSTVISALALPTSVIATFFFIWSVGFTINMMTLMALSLVIGILIDDAVVVRENIYRHLEHGEDPMAAAHRGTAEIGLAVMATTFSILAVFLPVGFMGGIVGQFFKEFALTVAFAVSMSLLVAFTLDPMLSSRFVRYVSPEEQRRTRLGRMLQQWGASYDRLDRGYHRLLRAALAHPGVVIAVAGMVFATSLGSARLLETEFMPAEDRGQFELAIDLPPGTSFDDSERRIAAIEQIVAAEPEVRQVFSQIGVDGDSRKSMLRVKTVPKTERTRRLSDIKESLRRTLAAIPFAEIKVLNPPFMQGTPSRAPILVYVRGDDLARLQAISDELVRRAKQIPGARDVSSTLVGGQPEMLARVDRAVAADMGFSVGAVAQQLRGMVEGIVPSKFRDGEKQYDIRLRLAPAFRNDFAALARAPLQSPTGTAVRVGEIVTLTPALGPARIQREQRRRQARIGIDISGRALGAVTADVERVLADMKIPANVEVGFQGDVELMQETMRNIGLALLLAVVFIYIVLASQFDSFLEPLIIMLSLPLAMVGALLLLLATRQLLGMPALIGIVMLMGLVTKNAILLVDYTNQVRRRDGHGVLEALLIAGPVRLRPILMTTMAMILGMLPSAFGLGQGSEIRAPMALATIGGLVTSTLLTLVLVPVAYLLTARVIERLAAGRRATRHTVDALVIVTAVVGSSGTCAVGTAAAAEQTPTTLSSAAASATASPPLVLTIDAALQYALEHNEAIRAARERVAATQARVAEARAAFLPSIDLAYLYTPAQEFPLIRIPAGLFGPNEINIPGAFTRQNIMRVEVTQPLYTGGRLTSAVRARAHQEEQVEQERRRGEQSLELQVVQAFYGAMMNDQSLHVAEEGVRLAETHLALARTRFEAGTAARLDVLRGEVELASARTQLIRARAGAEVSHQALRTVLSLPPRTSLTLEGSLDAPVALPDRAVLLDAVAARPDVRALEAQRSMAERGAEFARAEMRPAAALTGHLQFQDDSPSSLWRASNRSYQVALAFRVPLFIAPAARARGAAARADARQATHGRNALVDGGRLEVESAYSEYEAAGQIVATQESAIALAREGLAIAEVSYQAGVITASELNEAKMALLTTELGLMQAKYARLVAAARTRFAAGIR